LIHDKKDKKEITSKFNHKDSLVIKDNNSQNKALQDKMSELVGMFYYYKLLTIKYLYNNIFTL